MSWTSPQTWSTGDVPSTSHFNVDIRDNTNFLYSAMNTTVLSSTAKTLQTEYQNTTGLFRFISVVVSSNTTATTSAITVISYVASSSPATNAISKFFDPEEVTQRTYSLFFPVPPGYYYSVSTAPTTAVLDTWVETAFHAT